ncbi:unnamed protein product, partial [marine sediment metagenome]
GNKNSAGGEVSEGKGGGGTFLIIGNFTARVANLRFNKAF